MDPTTTVVLMTLNLAVTGALMALIARRTPGQQALLYCAASTWMFAAGFGLRLALGLGSADGLALIADAAMVLAAGLFLHGQRRYLRQVEANLQPWLVLAAVFVLAQMVATHAYGQAGRHVLLNSTLGLQYLAMAGLAGLGWRRLPSAERPAQGLMFGVAAVLGSATAMRAVDAAARWVETLFVGPTAQAYCALSSICILLMGPSVLWWMHGCSPIWTISRPSTTATATPWATVCSEPSRSR
jgi:hypothetical protein